jgi:hypothetical protein
VLISAVASAAASAAFRRRRRPRASSPLGEREDKMSEDIKKGGWTSPATEDGRKDSRKMSERDKKKKKCDYCQVPNFTKYDCQTCKGEFCSDCTNLKPADCKVILS